MRDIYRNNAYPVLVGHRGVRGARPENTVAAIELAASQGAHAVEIDVRPCASGELVVAHDPTLERVTGGDDQRAISSLTRVDLAAVDLGGGARLPCLHTVLDRCAALGIGLNVELKNDVPDRFRAVRAAARALRSRDDLTMVVSSFDPRMLAAFRHLAPRVPIALLLHPEHPNVQLFAAPLGAVAVHLARSLAGSAAIARWHRRGLSVWVWTVNDPLEAERLLQDGADGIISDNPDRLAPLF